MKRRHPGGLVVLLVLCIAYVWFLSWSTQHLPERVATHFGFNGYPDRYATRSSAVSMMAGFGLGLPLILLGLSWLSRFLPASCINMPNREYWLAPERRAETQRIIGRLFIWLDCLLVCFMAGLQWLTIEANASNPVRMPTQLLIVVLGGFLFGMTLWCVLFIRRFKLPATGS